MRYYTYLNEKTLTLDEINAIIHKDCKNYLNVIGKHSIFTRATDNFNMTFGKKRTRQDRISKGMPDKIFKVFNEWLSKNGHLRRDNTAICIARDDERMTLFGLNFLFFPIGKFNYTWIETRDINMDDRRTGWYEELVDDYFRFGELDNYPKRTFESFFHTNKNIKEPYVEQYEIWFDCKEYYLASLNYFYWDKNKQKLDTIQYKPNEIPTYNVI